MGSGRSSLRPAIASWVSSASHAASAAARVGLPVSPATAWASLSLAQIHTRMLRL